MTEQTAVIAALTAIANRNLQVMKEKPLTIACPNAAAETLTGLGATMKGFYKSGKARWIMLEISEPMYPAIMELASKPRASSGQYAVSKTVTYTVYRQGEAVAQAVATDDDGTWEVQLIDGQTFSILKVSAKEVYPDTDTPERTAFFQPETGAKGYSLVNALKSAIAKIAGDEEEAEEAETEE
jgi:hypothetical protein